MSTKAQLEAEIVKMTEERGNLLRQIKNLKKRKNARPAAAAVKNDACLETESILTDQLAAAQLENDHLSTALSAKNHLLMSKQAKITKFIALSWFNRLFLSKEDIKKLL